MYKKMLLTAFFFLFISVTAHATVVIKVRAINPLDNEVMAPILYPLPKTLTLKDIIDKRIVYSGRRPPPIVEPIIEGGVANGGETAEGEINEVEVGDSEAPKEDAALMDITINYDDDKGYFYVDEEILLGPKEIVTLEIEVNDVWIIPQEEIEKLVNDTEIAYNMQSEVGNEESLAADLKKDILNSLAQVKKRQEENTIKNAGVEKHIKAFEKNVEILEQIEEDIYMLENLIEE